MKLLTGNSNKNLSQKISKFLKNRLVNSSIRKFSDGEIYIEINENISCLLYTSPSPRDPTKSRMPSSA